MEFPSIRLKRSRIASRYRSSPGEVSSLEESSDERKESVLLPEENEEEEDVAKTVDEPLLIRERKGRRVMGRGHRMFHRRQAEGTQHVQTGVLTVIVDVIATVDSNGNIVGRETLPPSTQDALSVAAAPTVPAVPPVPAFPSDLTVPAVPAASSVVFPSVPAYPFPSGVPTVQVSSSGFNSTSSISSTTLISSSSSNTSSTLSSTSTSSSSSSSSSSTSSSSSSSTSSSSSSSSTSSSSSSSSSTSQPISTSVFIGGGGANTAAPPAATNTATSNNTGSGNGSALSTPKVVGSVIGSLAGAAILLIFLLLLIRWHKRKQQGGALQLGNDSDAAENTDNQPIAASGQQMSQSKRTSFTPMFSRFSGMSRSTAETSTTGERSFQRISGRKLPSAFSEGMTSDQFAPREGTLSESSFYRDESGFYGGPGGPRPPPSPTSPAGTGALGQKEKMMPSPARTPVIHHPEDAPPWGTSRNGGNTLSPPHSPNPDVPPRGTLGRSHPSHDGSRGSKFTEDV